MYLNLFVIVILGVLFIVSEQKSPIAQLPKKSFSSVPFWAIVQ
jgi:hypothetical protein